MENEEKIKELLGQELQKAAALVEEQQGKRNEACVKIRGKLMSIAQFLITGECEECEKGDPNV
jgi:D-Tyr-tRNAtyr deacylase